MKGYEVFVVAASSMYLRKIFLFLFIVLFQFSADRTFSQSAVFEDGEELLYDVYYSFINIGWTRFNTERVSGKSNHFICRAKLKSNDALPFVNVDYEFISEIEVIGQTVKPHKFTAYEFKESKKSTVTCVFNYDSSFIAVKKTGFDGIIEVDKVIRTSTGFQDGLSIFYYARANASILETRYVPVIMHVDTALMKINFNNQKTEVDIDAVKYDVNSVHIDGFAYFNAVFGLTGDFEGWFSNDNARVPLKAKLQVQIGNVTLELVEWKRKGWTPPKY